MRRPVVVLALLAVLLAPGLVLPRTVEACSAGEDWDAVAESDVIIAGWVADMSIATEYEEPSPAVAGPQTFVPVWLDFEVDRYFKGEGGRHLSVLDGASVAFMNNETPAERARFEGALYWGGGGSCGALDDDPRGTYWVTGIAVREDGAHSLHRLMTFAWPTTSASDPSVLEAIAQLEERLGPGVTPATTGHGLAPTTDRGVPLAFAVLALAILGGARLATRERRGA